MTCMAPVASLFERLGGDAGINTFVHRLYDVMATDPEAAEVWRWHPDDIDDVKTRLHSFLSGWLGGPITYPERFGPPMMRRRHMGFPIGPKERDIWLKCARTALDETVPDTAARADLDYALTAMAEHMRNRDEHGQGAAGSCGCAGNCS